LFTHIHPITIIIIWVPFALYMLYWGMSYLPGQSSAIYLPVSFLIGVFRLDLR